MDARDRKLLHLQELVGQAAFFLLAPLYFLAIRVVLGYRVKGLREFREQCRQALREHEGPWLICANHLTMIDSVILTYAMQSMYDQVVHYRFLAWNLPERNNFQQSIVLATLCYLTKCIPVNRGGDRDEMKRVLEKCNYLLGRKQNLMVFPEGGRSRTGRVDTENYTYGVGRFLTDTEGCRVMCLYLRGDGQERHSTIPRWGERFTVNMEVLSPERPAGSGLRAQRDYAGQIVRRLAEMEEQYFDARGQRHRGSERAVKSRPERELALPQSRL